MLYIVCLGLFMPLIGFFSLIALSEKIKRNIAGIIACSTILISFACFVAFSIIHVRAGAIPEIFTLFQWIPVTGIDAQFTLRVDALSLLMTLIITGIGFLIHVYSIGYMDHEDDYARYFSLLNFFVFSMLLLVLAEHLLLLFVGWEGVGLASYLLIGFWYKLPVAAAAATKAFVVNRIGDLGLLIGLLLTFYIFQTGNVSEIFTDLNRFSSGDTILTVITLLFFVGAIGKSAQLPLHVWLPDAMAGPTPVSALIHAATMVTAGVYLIVRLHPLFLLAPLTMQVISIVGATTSLFAALCAVGQNDLKRVLAYSTISQLGLMFLACGAGAFYTAMFHLTTHAFVKALLFLSAGNVVHMLHGLTDMGKMGGLSKIFTKTHWLFLIGVLALAGVPPLAAFFSKEMILEIEYLLRFKTLFYMGIAISTLTAFYLTRAYCLTFLGQPRSEIIGAKEAPKIMLIPVAILALFSIVGGFIGDEIGKMPLLERFLSEMNVISPIEHELSTTFHITPEMMLAIAGAFLGLLSAFIIYTRMMDRPFAVLKNGFYIDKIYWYIIVVPLKAIAHFIAIPVETKIFDGSILAVTDAMSGVARGMQKMQSGQIRSYVAWMVIGMACITIYLVYN